MKPCENAHNSKYDEGGSFQMNAKRLKILIGYDGSACADAAIDDLRRAGLPDQAEVKVLTVSELWMPPPSGLELVEAAFGEQPPEQAPEALALAKRSVELLGLAFPGWELTPEVRAGSPAGELLHLAEIWLPDLIVVGSHGRTALGRLLLGSVSQRVATEARTSVRIARGRVETEPKPIRLLLGYDGSDYSLAAADAVSRRSWPGGTEVRILTAIDALTDVSGTLIDQTLHRAHVSQQQVVARLTDAGLAVSTMVEYGNPKQLIIEQAEVWGADAIFLGTRGLGRIGRWLLGSVALAILGRAHCSVEIVRAPAS